MKKRTKTLILCISIFVVAAVSGFGLWYLLHDRAPVGNGNVLDVAWYHENGTEFVITTAEELIEILKSMMKQLVTLPILKTLLYWNVLRALWIRDIVLSIYNWRNVGN